MIYLKASLHRLALNTEGKTLIEAMCVHEGVVAGGSDEVELSVYWV